MFEMPYTKKTVITAACIALCAVLPMAFHAFPNAGDIWLPMHIPVLLCGLICGPKFGILCGIMGPFLSSILTQMPPAANLPSMILELSCYGFVSGFIITRIKTGKQITDILISLVCAMIAGRIVYGVANAAIFNIGRFTLNGWLVSSFVTSLPGIVFQMIIIPLIITALQRALIIPDKY